jgi:hypothetical protein
MRKFLLLFNGIYIFSCLLNPLVAQSNKNQTAKAPIPSNVTVFFKKNGKTDSTKVPVKANLSNTPLTKKATHSNPTPRTSILSLPEKNKKLQSEKQFASVIKKTQQNTASIYKVRNEVRLPFNPGPVNNHQSLYIYSKVAVPKANSFVSARVASCSVDTITLTSQAQINNFSANFPSCTTPKYLIIDGTNASPAIADLNGLSSLTQVTQKFTIINTAITTLSSLTNLTLIDTLDLQHDSLLTSIGISPDSLGVINFINLPALTNIDNLSNNITTLSSIHIDSTGLTNVNGLSNIKNVNGGTDLNSGIAISNSAITSLSGLGNLETINWWIILTNNNQLSSLGLHKLKQTYGFLFDGLPLLTSLEDISYHLTNGNISTFWMFRTGLTNAVGLDSLTSVPNFYFGSNPNLTSLHGLEKLQGDVNSGISLTNNPLLANISALNGITSINCGCGVLELDNNSILSNLTGLGNITNIGGNLTVANSNVIDSLNFLNPNLTILNSNNDQTLNIYSNPNLTYCNFAPVCNYLSKGMPVQIHDNALGCADSVTVTTACSTVMTCNGTDTLTWNGNTSQDWNNATNWTPNKVPTSCSLVDIPNDNNLNNFPMAGNNISIAGLIMEDGSEFDLNNFSLNTIGTFNLSNASIYNGVNIAASNIYAPNVQNSQITANLSILNYTGKSQFLFNSITGNTILSDSSGRNTDNAFTYGNNFYGNLSFVNNSDYGNNYLSNASPAVDYIQDNLTVINNSVAGISLGLGSGNPLKIAGNFIVNASNGDVGINNLTFVGNAHNHITQAGTLPITIANLFLTAGQYAVLDQNTYINNSLNFTANEPGILTDINKLLILNNNCNVTGTYNNYTAFVMGPVKKIGNQPFTFPIGTIEQNTYWNAPLTITAPASSTDSYTAQYFHHSAKLDGYDTSLVQPGFGGVQGREYWTLARNNGVSNVRVTLAYDSGRSGYTPLYNYMQVAGWDGSMWRNRHSAGFTGNVFGGSLLSGDSLSTFGPLTFSFKPLRKPVITMITTDSVHCLNTGFNVPYTADTAMIAGNTLRVEVSDTLGNFNNFFNPTFGSKLTSAAVDSIPFLSFALLPNKPYKIRIVGNLPPDTSVNTKTIIFITSPQLAFNIVGATTACLGAGVQKYYVSYHEPNANYTWTLSGGGTFTTVADTALVTWNTAGTYNLTLQSSNKCGNGPQKALSVLVNPPAPSSAPAINNTGRWLYASQAPASAGYQWYNNGTIISGANNSSYYASLAGSYTAVFAASCGNSPVSNAVSFAANSIGQTIVFPALANKNYDDAPFSPNITASSGLPVSLSIVSGPATITTQTNSITLTGTGVVIIKASQLGNSVYDTAAPITGSFTVNAATQTINFPSIPDQDISNGTVKLNATASSASPITYSIVSGPATVANNIVTLTGVGTVTVRASQAGNVNYSAATNVDVSFCTSVSNLNPIVGFTNLCPATATYTVNNISGATYFWRIIGGSTLASTTNSTNINWLSPGVYSVLVSASGNCGAASKNDTLVVNVINSIQPDSVNSMLPTNNAINQQLPLTLSWIPAQPANFYTFDLYVWPAGNGQPTTPYKTGLTSLNYTLPIGSGFLSNTAYKWMVVAHNGSCTQINTGPVQQFTLIPLPDLAVQNVQAPATAFSGQTISINWTVKNNGPGRTTTNQNWTDAVFLSFDSVPNFNIPPQTNPPAWSALQFPVRPLLVGTKSNLSALDSGMQYSNSINFTLPLNYSQPLYAYVITNYPAGTNAPQQVNVANDTAKAPQPVIVTLSPTPDLRVDTVFTPTTTFSGSTINLTYKVKNYGVLTPSGAAWTDKVYISQNPIFNINTATAVEFPKANGTYYAGTTDASAYISAQLNADSFYTKSIPIVIPNYIFGTYFIYVFTNATSSLYEGALNNNNTNSNQLQVFLTPTPHLTVSSLTVPVTTVSTTQPIGTNWNIFNTGFNDNIEKNKGHYIVHSGACTIGCPPCNNCVCNPTPGIMFADSAGFGGSYWIDNVYLSTDGSGLNVNNAILVSQSPLGVLNAGLYADDYSTPFTSGCSPIGTSGLSYNSNTNNVIKPSGNYPNAANFVIPDNLAPGNYYIYVLTNATNTVYQYPGAPETRRSALALTVQRPDAIVSSINVPANTTGGQPFTIQYSIQNNGPGAVYNHVRNDRIYVSNSSVFDGSAQLLTTQTYTENLPVGINVPHTVNITFAPSTLGTKYLYVYTNFDSTFRENNSANNISTAAATNVTTAIPNDLTVSSVQLADTVYTSYPTLFKYTVADAGSGTTAGTWTDSIFISCNATFNPATAYYIGSRQHSNVITGGGTYTDSVYLNIPFAFFINYCFPKATSATAWYFVKTNADNIVYEGSNTNNNITSSGSRITINPLVDQIVTRVTGPDSAIVGRPYPVNWTVQNIGANPLNTTYYSAWIDAAYFSTDSTFNTNAVLAYGSGESSTLANQQTYSDSRSVTAPNIVTGDYYVFINTNANNNIQAEINLSNNNNLIRNTNGTAKKIHVTQPLLPDLTDSILSAPAYVAIGQPLTFIHRVTNNGAGPTYPSTWSNDAWLNTSFVPGNVQVSGKNHSGALLPGQYYDDTVTAIISMNTLPQNYILISRVNASGNVFETTTTNNLAFKYVTVYSPAPADLVVSNISIPDTAYLGYPITTAQWSIQNNSPNTASGVSSDGIYLSKGTVLDSTATLIGIKNKVLNMSPLQTNSIALTPTVTNLPEGNYNVIVKTDLLNNIVESNKNNNTGIAAKQIYVSVKPISLNVPVTNTLFTNSVFYKLVIPDTLNGATILVTLTSNDSLSMVNQMYIGQGYVPSAAQFDYAYSTPNYGNQNIVITSATAGAYYISISNVSASPLMQNISLLAVKLPFAILNVQSSSGGNIGNVTVKISGSLFTNNMVATFNKQGTVIRASSVYFTNTTLVYATFNLQGQPLGIYDVKLMKADSTTAVLPQSFSVVAANNGGLNNGGGINTGAGDGSSPGCDPGATGGINSQIVTQIVAPEKVFGGWAFVIQINYNNPTNTDIPAQTRVLYSLDGLPVSLSQQTLSSAGTSLYLQLIGQDGPPGIIRAGGSGTITIYSQAPVTFPAHKLAHYELK